MRKLRFPNLSVRSLISSLLLQVKWSLRKTERFMLRDFQVFSTLTKQISELKKRLQRHFPGQLLMKRHSVRLLLRLQTRKSLHIRQLKSISQRQIPSFSPTLRSLKDALTERMNVTEESRSLMKSSMRQRNPRLPRISRA